MKPRMIAGTMALSVAIGACLLLGTVGWLVLGIGPMTDCTNNYSCSTSGCSPCATTRGWINAGGIGELMLAGVGIAAMVRGLRAERPAYLATVGLALLALSVVTAVATTWRAHESYCRPGTPGYEDSYCSVGA